MSRQDGFVHPYVPNAAPGPRAAMLAAVGADSIETLYDGLPEDVRLQRLLDLPPAIPSEHALRRHLDGLVDKNRHCGRLLSFLGGGCWQHAVPAVCDEIAMRGEFLTAYGGVGYADHGKFAALFDFQSLVGELVGLDVVTAPTYDAGCAAGSAVLMACRLTGRREILVTDTLGAIRRSQLDGFTKPFATIASVGHGADGLIDLADLEARLSDETAALYVEVPSHLGLIETKLTEVVALARRRQAMVIVGVDPISLGVLAAPGDYGADIVVGELQSLGIHMYGGGGVAGFIACRDDARVVGELPTYLVSAVPTVDGTGIGFGVSTMERTSYDTREAATDYYGTTQWLWGITAGAYLALMGPQGMAEVGRGIMQRAQYAARRLGQIPGVVAGLADAPFFKEFPVSFAATGKTVEAVNAALLDRGILGGAPLKCDFPWLGESALYAVTEIHGADEIERLATALEEVLR